MFTIDEKRKAAELAAEYFGNGYHCAEAIAAAVLQTMGEKSSEAVKYATAFGGGFGQSFQEACGVLTGCLIVIGHFYGKQQQGDSWSEAAELGAIVVERFSKMYGTCNCGELRSRFGPEEQMFLCRQLVSQGAESLLVMLDERESSGTLEKECPSTCSNC